MARWIATWFCCGYSPVAPGTAGSLAALVIAFILQRFAGWSAVHFALLSAALCAPAVWAAGVTARRMEKSDPGIVVVDEVVGQWVTLTGIGAYHWQSWLAALLFFRLFDILKPPPVRQMERLPGGVGIVADDVAAGIYSALVLYAVESLGLYW